MLYLGAEFRDGDATKQKSVKNSAFSLNEGKAFSEWRLWQGIPQGRQFTEAEISEEKRLFTEWGQGIQWMKALVGNSTGKAIHWRGFGHSVNRQTLKIEFSVLIPFPNLGSYYHSFRINTFKTWRQIFLGQGGGGVGVYKIWPRRKGFQGFSSFGQKSAWLFVQLKGSSWLLRMDSSVMFFTSTCLRCRFDLQCTSLNYWKGPMGIPVKGI